MQTDRQFLTQTQFSRRRLLGMGLGGAVMITTRPLSAAADQADLEAARQSLFGARPVQSGRVSLKLPPIAENGYSVPLTVGVDSPMSPEDYIKRIAILSPRNPVALISTFELGPANGKAEVSTRVRLGGTQSLQAIAEHSDGTLWSGEMETVVTLAACIVL